MINRQIIYERDIHKSYMKISSIQEECYDEKIMFRRDFVGTIPMEKCYINGAAQYWYNISGMQALDAYCRVNEIGRNFFETLILRICEQIEILEWNLIDCNCLVVDPELIFLNSKGEDISFVLYPQNKGNISEELQQLVEYLLTKLNHGDKYGIQSVYQLYEMTLTENYNIFDLKKMILQGRVKEQKEENENCCISQGVSTMEERLVFSEEDTVEQPKFLDTLNELWEKAKEILCRKPGDFFRNKKYDKEDIPDVIYPKDVEEKEKIEINPTVCLAVSLGEPRGVLIYEGIGAYPDFEIGQMICVIGKSHRARLRIERETVSNFHAKIDYINGTYYIEDMNSTNGTYLNEEIINYKERKSLKSGDIIRFADVKYRFL